MKCMRKSKSGRRGRTQTLAAAVDCGNWVVVRDLLCDEDVDVADIERCLALHKLASTPDISLSLVEDIVDEMLSRDVDINMADNNGDTAVMVAARCENWKVVWLLMSRQGALPDKDRVIAFLRILGRSEYMNKNCGLSANILGCLYDSLMKAIPECHHRAIHDLLAPVAAKVSCWWLVRDLLPAAIDYNTLDEDGMGVVHRLAQGGKMSHIFLLSKVHKSGGDINLKNADGNTATHLAVKNKKWNMAWVLLRRGARVDILNNDKHTVLHMMALYLRPATKICTNIFTLLKRDCLNIDTRDSRGNTALQLAVKEGNTEVAEKLLNIGARADVLDENGGSVLHTMAAQNHEYSSSLLKQVIACGAELETKNLEGNTALHVAAKLDNWDNVDKLIANGAVVTEPDNEGFTVSDRILRSKTSHTDLNKIHFLENFPVNVQLHLAVKLRRWKVLEELVKEGADVNSPDRFGSTLLQRLAQLDSKAHIVGVFGFLVNRGANRAIRTSAGDNLLHLAARNKHWMVVHQLLRRRFSAYEPDSEGYCVLHRLAEYRGKSLSALFSLLHNERATTSARAPSGDTLLQLAAKHGNIPMVEYLVQEGAKTNINQLDSEGLSVIHQIAQCQSEYREGNLVSVVNLLLSKGANPRLRNLVGDTALHLAASHNNWNIVESLVERGCDLNQPDSKGFYILHRLAQTEESFKYTSSKGSLDTLFCMLLEKGAHPFARSPSGETVLHMAAKHRKWTMVKHLVERGANINEPDSEGFHVLHRLVQDPVLHIIAAQKSGNYESRGRTPLIHVLITKGADLTARSPRGDSVFHLAARNDNWNIIEQILTHEPDGVESKTSTDSESEGLIIPYMLVINNYTREIERVDEPDSEGFTILHRLARSSNSYVRYISLLRFLLDKGARCDTLCPSGDSAMHLAAQHNNWYILEELLQDKIKTQSVPPATSKNVCQVVDKRVGLKRTHRSKIVRKQCGRVAFNINTKDSHGNTVLHLSAKAMNWNQVHTLLTCGADATLTDDEGHTVLYRLATADGLNINDNHMHRVLEMLRPKSAGKMDRYEVCVALIKIATKNKNVEVVETLLDHLDDVNIRDSSGLTILHRVVQCSSPVSLNIVKTLMKRKADTEIPGPKGDTALHLAAQCGNWDVVRELLENGARAGNTDSQGMYVLHRLIRGDKSSCKPATYSFLSSAVCSSARNSTERKVLFVNLMVRNGVDINAKDNKGMTALQMALFGKEWEVVHFLLVSGAHVDPNNPLKGKSPVHELAVDTGVDAVTARLVTQQLVVHGINLNERDTQGDTPLNLAAKCGNWEVVRALLEHGADASLPDSQGWFVCHRLARNNSHLELSGASLSSLLLLLTRNGFQANQTGPDGKSCVELSIEYCHWELFWWLAEFGVDYCFTLKEKKTILGCNFLLMINTADENKLRTLILHVAEKDDFSCRELMECKNEALNMSFVSCKWVVAKALVQCGADFGINVCGMPLMHFLMSEYLQSDHETWLSFLDALLAQGADINSRDENGRTILFQSLWNMRAHTRPCASNSLLRALLDRGASPLIADCNGRSILRDVLDLDERLALKYVQFLIELGISTYQPALTETFNIPSQSGSIHLSTRSPSQQAFEKRYVRAFEMLVESGASSNRELFELSTRYQVELSSRDMTTAETQMLDILNHAASQPRSLKSLCRLTVSHALGCGPHRMDRAKSLPLPVALHDYVLFSDLLSTELPSPAEETKDLYFQGIESHFSHFSPRHSPQSAFYDYEREYCLSPRYSYSYD